MGVSLSGSGFGNAGLQSFAVQKQAEAFQADANLLQAEQNLRAATQNKSPHFGEIQALAKEVELKKSLAGQKHTEANTAQKNSKINFLA